MSRYQVTCAIREKGKYITHMGGPGWVKPVERIKDELSIHLNVYYTLDTNATHYLDNLPDC